MNHAPDRTGAPGLSCDYVRARRSRRSFRLFIAVSVLLTAILWFSEGYLRYDRSETQYRMALTLHPAQARPILRTVVRRETEERKVPPSLYLEALALVEEPGKILDTYAKAYQVNPRNAFLVINYGCYLYADGQFEEARERFREAGVNPPGNALPRYLEAAALTATLEADANLSDLVALLTRANISADPVIFPEPLWHASLPKRGERYGRLQQEIAERMSLPLLQCCNFITSRAQQSIEQGELSDWDGWLEKVQVMGARLMGYRPGDSRPTVAQMKTALQIQHQALVLRGEWSRLSGGVMDPEINNALLLVNEALVAIDKFETGREQAAAEHRVRAMLPIVLIVKTGVLFLALYAASLLLHMIGSGGKQLRAIPHLRLGKILPLAGFSLLLLLLCFLAAAQHLDKTTAFDGLAAPAWYCIVGVMLLVGLVYPWMQARAGLSQGMLSTDTGESSGNATARPLSVRRYLGVYGCLLRRYMGVQAGSLLVIVCIWCVAYRIAADTYPFQMELLTTGLETETTNLIRDIQAHLSDLLS